MPLKSKATGIHHLSREAFVLRRLYLPTIVALCVLSAAGTFAQDLGVSTQEPCGCYDIGQIWSRSLETNAAIESLKSSLSDVDFRYPVVDDPGADWPWPGIDDAWLRANLRLSAALAGFLAKQVNEHGTNANFEVPGVQASTAYRAKEGKCATVVPDEIRRQATPCQLAWIDVHEGVHREGCQKDGKAWNSKASNRIQEDINAYSTEHDWLELQRKRLLCACRYYNIRLEMEQDMGPAVETLKLVDSASPPRAYVDISLHPSRAGALTGEGEGTLKGDFRGRPNILGSVIHPLKFQISADGSKAPIHTTIQMALRDGGGLDLTTTGSTIESHSKSVGGEIATTVTDGQRTKSRHDREKDTAFTSVVDFAGLAKPTLCPLPGLLKCHATLDVADEYRTAQAANNKGRNVQSVLWSMAGVDQTALASCH
jgi:hypothetical protein